MHKITLKLILVFLIIFGFSNSIQSQTLKPPKEKEYLVVNEKKDVVFSVDPRTNKITEIFLREGDLENQFYDLKKKCYRCQFYTGKVKGEFRIRGSKIVSSKNSVFEIHTSSNLMKEAEFSPGAQFSPGTPFSLAGFRTTVVANNKGSFVLKSN